MRQLRHREIRGLGRGFPLPGLLFGAVPDLGRGFLLRKLRRGDVFGDRRRVDKLVCELPDWPIPDFLGLFRLRVVLRRSLFERCRVADQRLC